MSHEKHEYIFHISVCVICVQQCRATQTRVMWWQPCNPNTEKTLLCDSSQQTIGGNEEYYVKECFLTNSMLSYSTLWCFHAGVCCQHICIIKVIFKLCTHTIEWTVPSLTLWLGVWRLLWLLRWSGSPSSSTNWKYKKPKFKINLKVMNISFHNVWIGLQCNDRLQNLILRLLLTFETLKRKG